MAQIYNGVVRFAADSEPYDGGYGLRYNIAVTMDDPTAPKAREGVVRIYRSPESTEASYLRSLQEGDQVQLIYTNRENNRGFYTLLQQESQSPAPDPTTVNNPPQQQPATTGEQTYQVWTPYSVPQVSVLLELLKQETLILHSLYKSVLVVEPDLDKDIAMRITSTAYINGRNKWRENMVTEDQLAQMQEEEGDEIPF